MSLDLVGIAYRAYQRKDRITALVARWKPLLQLASANKPLLDETMALVDEIVPGLAPPATYSVEWIQASLNKLGVHLDVDNQYGPQTKAAVMMFQQDNGLVVDGWVGVETGALLNAKVSGG